MSAALELDYSTYCPSCGNWDKEIDPTFGWCLGCIEDYLCAISEHLPNVRFCTTCGDPFPAGNQSSECWKCKEERYFLVHCERIEELETEGLHSMKQVRLVIAREQIRYCCICNKPIPRSKTKYELSFCPDHQSEAAAYKRRVLKGMGSKRAFKEAIEIVRP